jgi:hypothetical protein
MEGTVSSFDVLRLTSTGDFRILCGHPENSIAEEMTMAVKKVTTEALTLQKIRQILDPGRVFYRPAVDDVLKRGEVSEIQALIKGAKDVKAKYGSIDGLIAKLEAAAQKAK